MGRDSVLDHVATLPHVGVEGKEAWLERIQKPFILIVLPAAADGMDLCTSLP